MCTGIDNKKFTPIIESHKGNFHNQRGEHCSYYSYSFIYIANMQC